MNLYTLFERCLTIKYINIEGHISYNWEREDSTLYIYFQHSQGAQDWASNFNFPHRAYKAGGEEHFAHRGYLEAWECVLPYLEPKILDRSLSSIIVVGYSHGAGIGTLCHEYIWHKRSDIRKSCYGFGFGSPRVMWGKECTLCNEIWKNYLVIKNIDDIVTDDEELNSFLFSLGCYSGEPITVISRKKGGCVVSVKDARYNIDNDLAKAISIK